MPAVYIAVTSTEDETNGSFINFVQETTISDSLGNQFQLPRGTMIIVDHGVNDSRKPTMMKIDADEGDYIIRMKTRVLPPSS